MILGTMGWGLPQPLTDVICVDGSLEVVSPETGSEEGEGIEGGGAAAWRLREGEGGLEGARVALHAVPHRQVSLHRDAHLLQKRD